MINENSLRDRAIALLDKVAKVVGPAKRSGDHVRAGISWEAREPKVPLDRELHLLLSSELNSTGIPILSEEGDIDSLWRSGGTLWIVDPLDGTLNYVRGTGPSAVSICLWSGSGPVFGAVLDLGTLEIACGSKLAGTWLSKRRLRVSDVALPQEAVLCTGIPSGFDFSDRDAVTRWTTALSLFGKVRMLGSAASSLGLIARGAADCYYETNIKIWDVAAGIALVEGAGGVVRWSLGDGTTDVTVLASNVALAACAQSQIFP
jgi:myo-inositol-1(or 4)-monophosphatase